MAIDTDSIQFQALLAVLGDEDKAKAAYERIQPTTEAPTDEQQLLDAGFTPEQVAKALEAPKPAAKKASKAKAAKKSAPLASVTPIETAKERLSRQVDEAGLAFTRGRVYVTKEIIEAQARTMRNGRSQIVKASGKGHISHVLIAKEETGDVSVQNLGPKKES